MRPVRTFGEWRAGLPFRLRFLSIFAIGGLAGWLIVSLLTERGELALFFGMISAFVVVFAVYWKQLKSNDQDT